MLLTLKISVNDYRANNVRNNRSTDMATTPTVDSAISAYKAAADEAAAKSLKVATEVTKINGETGAIKKISPG
jgi:hypothetical protein